MNFAPESICHAGELRTSATMRAALDECIRELIHIRDCEYESISLADGTIPDPEDARELLRLDGIISRAQEALRR